MTKWRKVSENIKLWTLILLKFIIIVSKIDICQTKTSYLENYNFKSITSSINSTFSKESYEYFPKPLFNSHHYFRRKSLRRALRLASLHRGSYKNKRKSITEDYTWPVKRVAEIEGDIILGGLMMIHEREDKRICGPIMPQGGIQALECMLYTVDWVNNQKLLPGIKLGSYVLDDCDKDTYGLEQAVDFIKGKSHTILH